MTEFNFVNAIDLNSVEDYGAALLVGIASLKTLEAYHTEAFKKGLFDSVEEETSKTIIWEIQRLIALYKTQLQKVIEKTGFDEQEAINKFRRIMPKIPIPKKKKKGEVDGARRTQ